MEYLKDISIGVLTFLFGINYLSASNVSFLNDVLPENSRKAFEVSISQAKFDESLDVLNYIDKLSGSKPKKATVDEVSLYYKFNNGLKFTVERNSSTAEIIRNSIPRSLETEAESKFYSISYPVFSTKNKLFNLFFMT